MEIHGRVDRRAVPSLGARVRCLTGCRQHAVLSPADRTSPTPT
jgi:hypothetical protein